MLIAALLLAAFLVPILTGPAAREHRAHRRALRRAELDQPTARVLYLPSASCRGELDPEVARDFEQNVEQSRALHAWYRECYRRLAGCDRGCHHRRPAL